MRRPDDSILDVIWQGKFDPKGQRREFMPALSAGFEPAFTVAGDSAPRATLLAGDALAHAAELMARYSGTCDLIYLDPPFNTGREHEQTLDVGEGRSLTLRAYRDVWGEDAASFAHFLWQMLMLARELLAPEGSLWLHGHAQSAPLLRALLDDVFGEQRYRNQIIWHYTGGGRSRKVFSNKHDVLYWYSKSKRFTFNADAIREPYSPTSRYAKSGIRAASGKRYAPHPDGTPPDDVWDIPIVNPLAAERVGYPTQKPLPLLARIVKATSRPGDMVADLCCGSGTTLLAACDEERRALGVDANPAAIVLAASRLSASGHSLSAEHARDLVKPALSLSDATLKQINAALALESITFDLASDASSELRAIAEHSPLALIAGIALSSDVFAAPSLAFAARPGAPLPPLSRPQDSAPPHTLHLADWLGGLHAIPMKLPNQA